MLQNLSSHLLLALKSLLAFSYEYAPFFAARAIQMDCETTTATEKLDQATQMLQLRRPVRDLRRQLRTRAAAHKHYIALAPTTHAAVAPGEGPSSAPTAHAQEVS